MNALDYQKAMAHFIRFPEKTLEEVEALLGVGEISPSARETLRGLSVDPYVRKFGYKMRFCRQRDATTVMRLSRERIEPMVLDLMYREYFEPSRSQSDFVMLGVQFLEFILTDERCQALLKDGPAFLRDLLVYDYTKAFVERQTMVFDDPTLPRGARLRHKAFRVVDLKFDVPSVDKAKTKDPKVKFDPKAREMKLLFLRSEVPPYYRIFEIDEAVETFLKSQLEGCDASTVELPKNFPAMVSAGLALKEAPRQAEPLPK